ncbi:MAG: T9SS type A sorting domain-containing protein [Candidatus Neomarinimicrobiota bacterium]
MMKSINKFIVCIIFFTLLDAQDLCPPANLETYFYDQKIDLSWSQTASYGDVLFDECFLSCSTAVEQMTVEHDTSICGDCSGGWFRFSDGTPADCGSGMYPCEDGGEDDFSAYAGYSGTDTTTGVYAPVNSRLIGTADLSGYTAAYIEFTEAYTYPEDATANNYLEVSVDGGMSWDSVYVSIPDSIGEDYWFNTVEISQYAGSEIMFAFRYYCELGYGESWFVDDIKVYGGSEGQGNICGEFFHWNVYMDGVQIGTADIEEFSVDNLENGIEYCFEVTAVYGEGESVPSAAVCSSPMGPFQVNPSLINFDPLAAGQYHHEILTLQNFDTLDADFTISSIELSNIEAAQNLVLSTFEDGTLGDFTNIPDLGEEWTVGDSITHSSTYLPFPSPPDGSQNFALYNDDAAGDDPFNPATPMLVSNPAFSGSAPSFLVFDLYFPNPAGPCEEGAAYADDFKVKVSVDDGESWTLIDSSMATGVWYWASYMYNLEPYISEASSFRVGFQYTDCGGEWGYGVAIDRMAIKMGDDFTWLTVSPFRGNVSAFAGYNDSMSVQIGAYGVYDDFSMDDELLVESGAISFNIPITFGAEVSLDETEVTPLEFALDQNYPNPFNPETNIRFALAENSEVNISIFNLVGQKVVTLVNQTMEAGVYDVKWNGTNKSGSLLPTGMYFYEMRTSEYHSVKKLVLVK